MQTVEPKAFSYIQQWIFFGVLLPELYHVIEVPFDLKDFQQYSSGIGGGVEERFAWNKKGSPTMR